MPTKCTNTSTNTRQKTDRGLRGLRCSGTKDAGVAAGDRAKCPCVLLLRSEDLLHVTNVAPQNAHNLQTIEGRFLIHKIHFDERPLSNQGHPTAESA